MDSRGKPINAVAVVGSLAVIFMMPSVLIPGRGWFWLPKLVCWVLFVLAVLVIAAIIETPITDIRHPAERYGPDIKVYPHEVKGGKLVVWAQGTGESGLITSEVHRPWILAEGYDSFLAYDHARGGFGFNREVAAITRDIRRIQPKEILFMGFSLGAPVLIEVIERLQSVGMEVPMSAIWGCGVADGSDVKLPVRLAEYAHGFIAGAIIGAFNLIGVYAAAIGIGPHPETEDEMKGSEVLRRHRRRRAFGSQRSMLMQAVALNRITAPAAGRFPNIPTLFVNVDGNDVMVKESALPKLRRAFPWNAAVKVKGWVHNDVTDMPKAFRAVVEQFVRDPMALSRIAR